jgi:glycosyltransferase involved in cell wall biosynthesis
VLAGAVFFMLLPRCIYSRCPKVGRPRHDRGPVGFFHQGAGIALSRAGSFRLNRGPQFNTVLAGASADSGSGVTMTSASITIAICTWNRAESLRETLTSLSRMAVPAGVEWEVLVVNNNCTDATEEVVASFADRLPIRSAMETQQGQSHARNRAIALARGDYILWTDDDVLVDERWLVSYSEAFRASPETAVFGGPILPRFVGEPPRWLQATMRDVDNIGCIYALRDLGPEPIALEPKGNNIPFGANFAIRTVEQRKFPFDPRLGLQKEGNVRGEETDVMKKILLAGGSGRWVPNAAVHHVISRQRQTVAYIRDFFVGQGRLRVRNQARDSAHSSAGIPPWVWKAVVTSHMRYGFARISCPPGIWCRELRDASVYLGRYLEHRDIGRGQLK